MPRTTSAPTKLGAASVSANSQLSDSRLCLSPSCKAAIHDRLSVPRFPPLAFVLAAATVAIFNGLVRVADSTGIPLDDGTCNASIDFRDELGLNDYSGARSTRLDAALQARPKGSVAKLFGF